MIPLAKPALTGNETDYVLDALARGQLSGGEYVRRFEQRFARWIGVDHALATSSGTTALHLALLALRIGPGDEVLVPDLTYIATANAVTYCGATPVLCDVDPWTWGIDRIEAERHITPRTRAFIAVHLYGIPVDFQALSALSVENKIWIIEDAAEAHGALLQAADGNQVRIGAWGHIGCFSFYGNKILTTGEGGMVTTDDPQWAQRLHLLRGQGTTPSERYRHTEVGYNYRMSELQGAVGLAQVERADELCAKRQELYMKYRVRLAHVPWLAWQTPFPRARPAYWLPAAALSDDAPVTRDELMRQLAEQGIETRPVFPALHTQPIYRHLAQGPYPVAERLAERGICLPAFAEMTDEQVEQVCEAIEKSG